MRNMFGTLATDKRMDAMEREIPSQRDNTRFVKRQFDRTPLASDVQCLRRTDNMN